MSDPIQPTMRSAMENVQRLYAVLATANPTDLSDPVPGSELVRALLPLLRLMPAHRPHPPARN